MNETIIRAPLAWHNMTDDEIYREIDQASPELAETLLAIHQDELDQAVNEASEHAFDKGYAQGQSDLATQITEAYRRAGEDLPAIVQAILDDI